MDLTIVEIILGIVSVIIIPLSGVLIKNWADTQQLKSTVSDLKEEVRELEKGNTAHSQTLAVIDQKLQHIEQSIIAMNANITQLLQTFDKINK